MKFFLLVCLGFVFTNAFAQSTLKEELEKRVERVNKVLPISVQQGIVYEKEYILGNSVYSINKIDENYYMSLSLLAQEESTMKKNLLQKYSSDPNLISFAQMLIGCNMNLVVLYISKQSGKLLQITLSSNELKQYLK